MESESKIPDCISGTFHHALDPKFRLTVPSQWRSALGGAASLYVLPDVDNPHLKVLPASALANVMKESKRFTFRDRDRGAALRTFFANLEQVDLDVQGRIRISDRLLAFAGLAGTVTLQGRGHFFEVWAEARQPEQKAVPAEDLGDAMDLLDDVLNG